MDLCKFILLLLSLVFSLLLQVKLAAVRLWNVKKQLRSCAIRLVNYVWPRSVLTRPSKIPGHLALLINESQVNLNDVCKLLVLACKYGIDRVSIYEPRGFFGTVDSLARLDKLLRRKSRSRFKYRLLPRPPIVQNWSSVEYDGVGDIKKSDDVIGYRNDVIKEMDDVITSKNSGIGCRNDVMAIDESSSDICSFESNRQCDVITWDNDVIDEQNHFLPPTLCVYVLGANAGRWAIAQAAQLSVNCASLKGINFEFSSFLDTLSQFSAPEADLALVPSMAGYPPLALRLTELLFLPTHQSVTEANFVDWLETFGKRDRRCGK